MPVTITYQTLSEDLKTNNKFFDTYPDLVNEINQYRKSPNCGSCRNIVNKVLSGDIEKLKKVYGNDIVVNQTMPPNPPARHPFPVLKKMTLEEYEKYMNDNSQRPVMGMPSYPMYVPELKQVWVTMTEYREIK